MQPVLEQLKAQTGPSCRPCFVWHTRSHALQVLRRRFPGSSHEADCLQSGSLFAVLQHAASAIICGGIAGMVMWSAVFPIDAAKTLVWCFPIHAICCVLGRNKTPLLRLQAKGFPGICYCLPEEPCSRSKVSRPSHAPQIQTAYPGSKYDQLTIFQSLWTLYQEGEQRPRGQL
jgi:hypothetical protein